MLKPAPRGLGLAAANEGKKILYLAGIRDVWSKSFGNTRARINYAFAIFDAFKKLNSMKSVEPETKQVQEESEEATA